MCNITWLLQKTTDCESITKQLQILTSRNRKLKAKILVTYHILNAQCAQWSKTSAQCTYQSESGVWVVFNSKCNWLCNVQAFDAGVVWVNCSQPCFCQAPWGGKK
jgi:hypothetical protein